MNFIRRIPSGHRVVFFLSFAAAMLFAIYTNHVWEDYYITYRASKNLATGHGLVYNHGDRLHTFTSPLGVLLPALASGLTLNQSDTVALWIFRIISAAAFAGAATLLYATLLQLSQSLLIAALGAAWLALDAKSLDFTINGMETGLLLLFIALTLWAQFGNRIERRWLWLGVGWAGLMWTRPDGFLYIGLLTLGGWLFNDQVRSGLTRIQWLKIFLLAGLTCTVLYLPWFAGSWLYYGTPIPHTITAKAAIVGDPKTVAGAFHVALTLPVKLWTANTALSDAFMPSYHMMGGWPSVCLPFARLLACFAAFAWVVPFLDRPTRAVSFAFFGLHVYLSYFPYFPFPWYLPGTTLLGYFVMARLLAAVLRIVRKRSSSKPVPFRLVALTVSPALFVIAFNLWTTVGVARQFAAQQTWIENANRRKIGEWLHEHAKPDDRVFLEPLGYIGYFSGLKTYDFPGMSSREVVDEIRRIGNNWGPLIDQLAPEWIVLRPPEVEQVNRGYPLLLSSTYHEAQEFSVLDEVKKLDVPGRPYLEFDASFHVFRRNRPTRYVTELGEFHSRFPVSILNIDNREVRLVHAPGTWIVDIPAGAKHVHVAYGYPAPAYNGNPRTDGATFSVKMVNGTQEHMLLSRQMDPANRPQDRGLQNLEVELPSDSADAKLYLSTTTGITETNDWTCWCRPEFW